MRSARRGLATTANLPAQVGAFLLQYGGVAPPDGLYVIEMGGNDVRDRLRRVRQRADGSAFLQDALESIAINIQALHGAGARRFLVWRTPNVGTTSA